MKKLIFLLAALLTAMTAWASTFTVTNDGNTFTITRSSSSGTENVYYRTVNLSAIAGVHFTEAVGILNFLDGESEKTVTVTETPIGSIAEQYLFQMDTKRTYRFEVLDHSGSQLAYKDRDLTYGSDYQHSIDYVNQSITDLVYFDYNGNLRSDNDNRYLDVANSATDWIKVTDDGYPQGVHTISTDGLYHGSSALRTYLDHQGNRMYATVYFTQKEEDDGYQYIQILADNTSTYDDNDPRGTVNDPSISLYKACFELSYAGDIITDEHHQFFPHRYNHVNKAAEINAGISRYSFDNDYNYLYEQKYQSSAYDAPNTGSLNLATTVNNLNIRFDAGGNSTDNWYFKDLKVRLALVDNTAPTVLDNYQVSGGWHSKGNTIYVSIAFSEIVASFGQLNTTWGTLYYESGYGTNVLTFSGTISDNASGAFAVTDFSGVIADLAGNRFTGDISHNFGISLNDSYSITYDLAGGKWPEGQSYPETYTAQTATFTLVNPTRNGYTFAGWTGSNGDTPQLTVTIPKGSSGNLHYDAHWSPDTFTITYDLAGGTWPTYGDIPETYTIESYTFNLPFPTKPGHTFVGWTGTDLTDTTYIVIIEYGSYGDRNYTAIWERIDRYYTFDSETGTLALLWGEFNKNNKWNVPSNAVKSVTATSDVSFVGDCIALFHSYADLDSVDLNNVNTSEMTNAEYMFGYCSKLTSLDLTKWDTGKVTNMGGMFLECQNLTTVNLSGWNNTNLTTIWNMFGYCPNLKSVNLSGWRTDSLTDMSYMFQVCKKLETVNLSGWNNNKLNDMSYVFQHCENLKDVNFEGFNTSNVSNMNLLFFNCQSLTSLDISDWDTGNVTDMRLMFALCKGLTSLDIGGWNTGKVTNMRNMFQSCSSLTSLDIGGWNTVSATEMTQMFYDCTGLTSLDLSGWNTSNVTILGSMFGGCTGLTSLNISGWNTSNVLTTSNMFEGCTGLTELDLSGWDTGKTYGMSNMFAGCSNLATIYAGEDWTTENVTYSSGMFTDCTKLVGGKGTAYDPSHTDAEYAHIDGGADNPGYFTAKTTALRGDVNGDNNVSIGDVTALIDYLLSGDASGINTVSADCNLDSDISIADVTALIDYLLSSNW